MTRILVACLTIVLGVVFVVAGASKAWAPDEFQRVVSFLMPEVLRVPELTLSLAVGLATLEVFLGLSVLTIRHNRGVLCAVIATLAAWLIRSKQGTVLRVGRRGAAARANGFTLIEVLVVIAILAVLLALVVPALRHSRIAAKHNAQVQTIRQLNVALGMYCGDHRDQFPFFGTQGDPFGPIHIRGFRIGKIYFSTQRTYWASALLPEYYQGPRQSIERPGKAEVLQMRGYPDFIVAADYLVSSTVFAHSRFWMEDPSGGTSWYQTSYFKPTRLTDVAYPSGKGLLVADIAGHNGGTSFSGWYPGVPPPVAIADGSARAIPQREFDPDPSRAVDRPFGPGSLLPVLATRDGLLGWDF